MRAFVQRPLAVAAFGIAAVLAARALAQGESAPSTASAEPVEEVTVQGRKTLTQYRLEIEQARDEVFRRFNEANQGKDNDITCRAEQPTGSRMRQQVCRSEAENRAHASAAFDFLTGLFRSAGNFNEPGVPGGTQVVANIDTGEAQGDGQTGQADALTQFEAEWRRLLSEDRQPITVRHLPDEVKSVETRAAETAAEEEGLTLRERVALLEAQVIRSALRRTGGNKSEAARLLGVSYPSLLQKIKLYGVGFEREP